MGPLNRLRLINGLHEKHSAPILPSSWPVLLHLIGHCWVLQRLAWLQWGSIHWHAHNNSNNNNRPATTGRQQQLQLLSFASAAGGDDDDDCGGRLADQRTNGPSNKWTSGQVDQPRGVPSPWKFLLLLLNQWLAKWRRSISWLSRRESAPAVAALEATGEK